MTILSFTHHVNQRALPSYWLSCNYTTDAPSITESTARRWLYKLGFKPKKKQRGVYIDGHDSPENIASRLEFCREYEKLVLRGPLWITRRQVALWHEKNDIDTECDYDGNIDEILPIDQFPTVGIRSSSAFRSLGGGFHPDLRASGLKPVIIYSHDESIFHSNEDQNIYWGDNDISGLCKKSQGSGIFFSISFSKNSKDFDIHKSFH